jgi:hypothetical protein
MRKMLRPRYRHCLFTAIVLVVTACAGVARLPSQRGRRWWRLETDHFVLYTDQALSQAQASIGEFEHILDAYARVGWEMRGELPLKLDVAVLEDFNEFERLVGVNYGGAFRQQELVDPLAVLPGAARKDNWLPFKYDLAMHIAHQALPAAPYWVTRGLGKYFSCGYFAVDGSFVLGAVRGSELRWLVRVGHMATRELWALDEHNAPLYADMSAWLLVHYLLSEHGPAFAVFQTALANGASAEASWSRAFPDLPVDRLDQNLARYIDDGTFNNYSRAVTRRLIKPHVDTLSDADLYALRARLALASAASWDDRKLEAQRNLALALRAEPTHLQALALQQLVGDSRVPIDAVRAAVNAHPNEWLAWLLLARAEPGPASQCEPEVADHLEALAPHRATALIQAALCRARAGQRDNAVRLAERASHLEPRSPGLLNLQARILLALGECGRLKQVVAELQRLQPQAPVLAESCEAAAP